MVTFTRAQGGLPVLVFRRDGTASENGVIYLSTLAGLSIDRTADVRAVEISRAPAARRGIPSRPAAGRAAQ